MPCCAMYGCSEKSQKGLIRLHRFPENESLQNQWINSCMRSDKINLKNGRICSKHFSKQQYDSIVLQKFRLLGHTPQTAKLLLPDAVPDINLPASSSTANRPRPAGIKRHGRSKIQSGGHQDPKILLEAIVPLHHLKEWDLTSSFAETYKLSSRGLERCLEQLRSISILKDDKPGDILSPPLATVKIEPLEPISIKEEKELDESIEVSLKLEPLPWDESADFEALGGSEGAGGSCSSYPVKMQTPTSDLGEGGCTLVTSRPEQDGTPSDPSGGLCPMMISLLEHSENSTAYLQDLKEDVKEHLFVENGLVKGPSNENSDGCARCMCKNSKDRTAYMSYIKKHVVSRTKIQNEPLSCHICLHSKEVSYSALPFACNHCPYRTDKKDKLKRHLVSHEDNSPEKFACTHCPYKATHRLILVDHLLTHGGNKIKPFACNHCEYRGKRKDCLNKHILTHHSNRKMKLFACKLCKYRTSIKGYLRMHLLAHNKGEKPFACGQCQFKTCIQGNLKLHLRTHNNKDKPFSCHLCEYRTFVKSALMIHFHKHYGDKSKILD